MNRLHITMAIAVVFVASFGVSADDAKLRVICFGAHPDDCELKAGGVAALWSAQGHKVKFVSVTNGDIGHWKMDRDSLAKRRKAEVEACAKVLGIETQVLIFMTASWNPRSKTAKPLHGSFANGRPTS